MSIESNVHGDGSDIFWPGYVDAVTNLVLNLLFLLTIMTVAVFMFAMELGKAHKTPDIIPTPAAIESTPDAAPAKTSDEVRATEQEVEALRRKVETLQREVTAANELRTLQKVQQASAPVQQPTKSVDRATPAGGGIVVRYTDDAVSLTPAESEKLRNLLVPVVASGGARIDVVVPKGFSEAKRLGFYRAMSVRNLLIDMKLPASRIDVIVREGSNSADASQVRVLPRQ